MQKLNNQLKELASCEEAVGYWNDRQSLIAGLSVISLVACGALAYAGLNTKRAAMTTWGLRGMALSMVPFSFGAWWQHRAISRLDTVTTKLERQIKKVDALDMPRDQFERMPKSLKRVYISQLEHKMEQVFEPYGKLRTHRHRTKVGAYVGVGVAIGGLALFVGSMMTGWGAKLGLALGLPTMLGACMAVAYCAGERANTQWQIKRIHACATAAIKQDPALASKYGVAVRKLTHPDQIAHCLKARELVVNGPVDYARVAPKLTKLKARARYEQLVLCPRLRILEVDWVSAQVWASLPSYQHLERVHLRQVPDGFDARRIKLDELSLPLLPPCTAPLNIHVFHLILTSPGETWLGVVELLTVKRLTLHGNPGISSADIQKVMGKGRLKRLIIKQWTSSDDLRLSNVEALWDLRYEFWVKGQELKRTELSKVFRDHNRLEIREP